jgi:hypothetical protein
MLIGVYFSQVKINHDSHEFILEFGTVANMSDKMLMKRRKLKDEKMGLAKFLSLKRF